MEDFNDFEFKRRKYMPVFPRATGKPTTYIEGYPFEDDEPMAATGFHGEQIVTFSNQLRTHFGTDNLIYVGIDTFIYYQEGDRTRFVAPDIYVVLGVEPYPQRRSFYTWAEGAAPSVVFEFLSDSTAAHDRGEKARRYLVDMGVAEYFIHQPEGDKPVEFRGWCRSASGEISEIAPDAEGGLFSHTLNIWLRWVYIPVSKVRLLRPYLPDGTPIPTYEEWSELAENEKERRLQAEERVEAETQRREDAEELAQEEAQRRQQAERLAQQAERLAQEETQRRQQAESELERLRAEFAALRGSK
jgi:Uma2 family endonuclease